MPATTSVSGVAHGKRRRDAGKPYGEIEPLTAENYEGPPHKRVRGEASDGILEESQSRTCHKPETRVPTKNNHTSEEAGCGAERLATPNARGVYHHSLPGPSSQQGWVLTTVQLPWVEEREKEEVSHHINNVVQQEDEDHLFQIPSTLEEGCRLLLAATEADWMHGEIDQIRCRLCPNSGFRKWDDFQRHCRTTEAHPINISFCGHCGDFFARSDSLKRHLDRPPPECLEVTPERAEEKRQETERVHGDFMERLEHSLTTGEEIGVPFAHIIKQKYPESSKKRTGRGWERRRARA